MRSEFHPRADAELTRAARWYNARSPGLGQEFISAVLDALIQIERHPVRWPTPNHYPGRHDVHRYRLDRFDYSIVYQIAPTRAYIIAIAHNARRPNYWAKRLK